MPTPSVQNMFSALGHDSREEKITALLSAPNVRIDRIVSKGQASPPGFWWDQEWAEWVVLLTGAAGMLFEGDDKAARTARRRLSAHPRARAPSRRVDAQGAADHLARGPLPLTDSKR